MARRVLSFVLTAALTVQAMPLRQVHAQPSSGTSRDLGANVDASFRELAREARRLRPELDRSQFELEALLERLGYDPERIARFVTEEIALEVYPGVLRGARGTLVSRAGNSLDQALLLATLLRDAGFEAVIRRGRLSEAQAADVVWAMGAPRKPAPSIWRASAASTPGTAAQAGESSQRAAQRSAWRAAARAQADGLSADLTEAGVRLDPSSLLPQLVEEARDYYWVDHRVGPSQAWRPAHPVLGRDPGAAAVATFAGEVPAELTHEVILEVWVVQRRGSSTTRARLFAPLRLASAGLVGSSLDFTLSPDSLVNPNSRLELEPLVAATRFLIPIVNDAPPAGAQALSVRGLLTPLDSLALGAAGVFESVSERGARAAAALSALGAAATDDRAPAMAIEALELRVTFRSPGGGERTAVRDLFHQRRDLTPEARQAPPGPELVAALSRTHSFVFATGSYHEGFVLDSILTQVESLDEFQKVAASIEQEGCETIGCLSKKAWKAPDPGASRAMLYLAFDAVSRDRGTELSYRHTPNLVSVSRPLVPPRTGQAPPETRIDIVSNARRALGVAAGRVQPAADPLLVAGAWETLMEAALLARGDAGSPPPASSMRRLRRYSAAELVPHASGGDVASAMLRDLDLGYVVFGGDSLDPGSSSEEVRWWRIDPRTGETLGMNRFGGAAQVAETLAVLFIFLVVWAALVVGCGMAAPWVDGSPVLDFATCVKCANPAFALFTAGLMAVTWLTSDSMDSAGHAFDIGQKVWSACVASP